MCHIKPLCPRPGKEQFSSGHAALPPISGKYENAAQQMKSCIARGFFAEDWRLNGLARELHRPARAGRDGECFDGGDNRRDEGGGAGISVMRFDWLKTDVDSNVRRW